MTGKKVELWTTPDKGFDVQGIIDFTGTITQSSVDRNLYDRYFLSWGGEVFMPRVRYFPELGFVHFISDKIQFSDDRFACWFYNNDTKKSIVTGIIVINDVGFKQALFIIKEKRFMYYQNEVLVDDQIMKAVRMFSIHGGESPIYYFNEIASLYGGRYEYAALVKENKKQRDQSSVGGRVFLYDGIEKIESVRVSVETIDGKTKLTLLDRNEN